MIYTYLLFNAAVVAGPVVFSFDRKVRYVSRWSTALLASAGGMVPYILWDIRVTGTHWWFNVNYVTGITLFGLPVEEWLFFLAVPFACLFIWAIFKEKTPDFRLSVAPVIYGMTGVAGLVGIWILFTGPQYTAYVLIALGLVSGLDWLVGTRLLARQNTYRYLAIVTGLMLLFNGILTALPVVFYGESYHLGIRIITIPVEDFFYGYGLILLTTIFYELLEGRRYV